MNKIFKVSKRNWESNFFKKEMWELQIDFNQSFTSDELKQFLTTIPSEVEILEINFSVTYFDQVYKLEECNFRLLDSKIQFLTKVNKKEVIDVNKANNIKSFKVRDAIDLDEIRIIELVNKYFVEGNRFKSRYKNRLFFTPAETKKYYEQWVKFSFQEKDMAISVVESEGYVVGFFIFQRKRIEGDIHYKGILTAIEREYRGENLHIELQEFLYDKFNDDEFFIDNTTQLANIPVIKNHIKTGRQLKQITLNMMLDF